MKGECEGKLASLQRNIGVGVTCAMSMASCSALDAPLNLQSLINTYIQSTGIREAHGLIRLDLLAHSGRKRHRALKEIRRIQFL